MGFLKLAAIGGLIGLLIQVLFMLDVNKRVYTHYPGHCIPVQGLNDGSEDAVMLDNGFALISSGIHVFGQKESFAPGRLFTLDLRPDAPQPRKLTELKITGHPKRDDFHPAGIDFWKVADSRYLIYAVNVPAKGVDVFQADLNTGEAKFRNTIKVEGFKGMNNLVVVGEDKFYATNSIMSSNWILINVEMALPLPLGDVVYFDGKSAKKVAGGLRFPNGIALSKDKKHVYVASTADESILIYARNPTDNSLEFKQSVPLGSGLDNINVDPGTGDIYVGSHPVAYKILMNMQNRDTLAPSHVLRVQIDHTKSPVGQKVTEVFADEGTLISASAVAVKHGRLLFIGSLNSKAVLCSTNF